MKALIVVCLAVIAGTCHAEWSPAQEDLDNCIWRRTGERMSKSTCERFREEVRLDRERNERLRKEMEADGAKWAEEKARQDERQRADAEAIEREYAQRRAEEDEQQRQAIEAAKQSERDEEAVQKRRCGKDFRRLRVGMTIKRFEECWEALSYVTETVGTGGVVETYRSTFYFIHAQGGRVVGYTRRTD